jgi:hypothetical protein
MHYKAPILTSIILILIAYLYLSTFHIIPQFKEFKYFFLIITVLETLITIFYFLYYKYNKIFRNKKFELIKLREAKNTSIFFSCFIFIINLFIFQKLTVCSSCYATGSEGMFFLPLFLISFILILRYVLKLNKVFYLILFAFLLSILGLVMSIKIYW